MEQTITLLRLEERYATPPMQSDEDRQHSMKVEQMSALLRMCHLRFCPSCRKIAAWRELFI